MPNPPGQAPSHLRSPHGAASVHLDALRGIAAVGVCFSHLRDFFFQDYPKVPHHNPLLAAGYLATGLGHQWVIVFFVLSGYLVGGSVLRSFALDRWSWRSYLLNRMTRLYTVLVPALVLGGLLDVAGIHLFGEGGIYGGHTGAHELVFRVSSHLTLPIMIGNYALLQGIYVPTFGSNGPLWSLANEFWYYIAFPFLALALWRRRSVPLRLVNVVLLVAVVAFMRPPIALMGIIWLMGVAIHYLPHLPAENVLVRRLLMVAAILACCATLAWCKQTPQSNCGLCSRRGDYGTDLCRPELLANAYAQGLQLDGARAFPLVVHAVPGARSAAGFHRGVDGACAATSKCAVGA